MEKEERRKFMLKVAESIATEDEYYNAVYRDFIESGYDHEEATQQVAGLFLAHMWLVDRLSEGSPVDIESYKKDMKDGALSAYLMPPHLEGDLKEKAQLILAD